MKKLLCLLILTSLVGCSEYDVVGKTSSGAEVFNEICIDNVVYLQRYKGYKGYMAVKFNPDSTVVTCK